MPGLAQAVVFAVAAYAASGLIFAVAFVSLAVQRIDAAARGAGWVFRILIIPGCAALWPLMLYRWIAHLRKGRTIP